MNTPESPARKWAELLETLRERGALSPAPEPLFERWLKRDHWRLRADALPLLCAADPERWPEHLADADVAAAEGRLWSALESCGAIQALHADVPPGVSDPACRPAVLRRWARAHHAPMPPALDALLAFVERAVGSTESPEPGPESQAPASAHPDTAAVLGAALAVVARWPDLCRDDHGLVDPARVANVIAEKAALWFDEAAPPLTTERMAEVLAPWLD